jgi:hypothetical protein
MKANPNVMIGAGLVVVIVTLAAYIYCEAHGIESGPIVAITGPVIAALLLQQSIARVESQARQAVENTNGKLDGGIRDAVAAELNAQLDARGLHRVNAPNTSGGPTSGMTTADDPTQPR